MQFLLSKTKESSRSIDNLKKHWNLLGVGVISIGTLGGLALLWNKNISLNLMSYSWNHMDATARLTENGPQVQLTEIYGALETNQHQFTWNLIRRLNIGNHQPWFLGGEFNDILHSVEKERDIDRTSSQMVSFNLTLIDCELSDIGFEGCFFTWTNNQRTPRTVRCKLDRVCVNQVAMTLFLRAMV